MYININSHENIIVFNICLLISERQAIYFYALG